MKKKLVSKGLYADGLRKTKITAIIFLAFIVLAQVIIPMIIYRDRSEFFSKFVVNVDQMLMPLEVIPYLLAPLLVLILFSAFNKRGASDFYQALPYTRTCIYISWTLSILTICAAEFAVGFVGKILVTVARPDVYAISFADASISLLTYLARVLFAIAATLMAVSVTGTIFSNVACTLLIMFLPRMILALVRYMIMETTPIVSTKFFARLLSYQYNVYIGAPVNLVRYSFAGTNLQFTYDNIIFTIVLSLCYFFIAMFLFKKRKSETATNSAQNKIVQTIIRCAICFAISLLGTVILFLTDDEENWVIAIVLYIIAAIVYFAYEIISTRKWKNLVKAMPALVIVVCLNFLVIGGVALTKNIILNKEIPAQSIKSIRLVDDNSSYYYDLDYLTLVYDNIDIRDPEALELVSQRLSEDLEAYRTDDYYRYSVYDNFIISRSSYVVKINTSSGTVYRRIRFSSEEMSSIRGSVAGTKEFEDAIMVLPAQVSGTASVGLRINGNGVENPVDDSALAKEIHETLQKDINAMGSEKWLSVLDDEGVEYSTPYIYYNYRYTLDGFNYYYLNLRINPELFPESIKLMQSVINEDIEASRAELIKRIELVKFNKDILEYVDIDMTLYMDNGENVYNIFAYYYPDEETLEYPEKNIELLEEIVNSDCDLDSGNYAWITMYHNLSEPVEEEMSYSTEVMIPIPEDFDLEKYADLFAQDIIEY